MKRRVSFKFVLVLIVQKYFSKILSDRLYLEIIYYFLFGNKLNLRNPQTLNEKLNWLKLYGRKDIYTMLADKYEVKKYVSDKIGDNFVVKNLGVYDNWNQIDFESLPDQFVIKCTHDSGGAFVCTDKKSFDFSSVKEKVERNLKKNFFYYYREWPYKNIKPRIIVDTYLNDSTGDELRDYKFWCFNGLPQFVYFTIKGKNVYENFYDMDFKVVNIDHGFPRHSPEFQKPEGFEKMKELAQILSKDIPFVRVDFFYVDGKILFGEFTFYDWGGMRPFKGGWDYKLGQKIILPKNIK